MAFSRSRSSTSTSSQTRNDVRNVNLQDTQGTTVGEAGGSVTITQTDLGAISSATRLAQDALAVGAQAADNATRVTLETSAATRDYSLTVLDRVGDFVGSFLDTTQRQTGQTVAALNSIAVESNKSTDQRVSEISEKALRYGLAAIALVAVVYLIRREKF